ncbi:ATP-binding protein [Sphingomonas sp. MMS24-JH45]
MLLNLLNNALRFTPRGGEVDVALARREGGAVVTVADTGVGLPPEMLANPFRRFSTSARPLHGRRGWGSGSPSRRRWRARWGARSRSIRPPAGARPSASCCRSADDYTAV